jgi:hypothetical protein
MGNVASADGTLPSPPRRFTDGSFRIRKSPQRAIFVISGIEKIRLVRVR